VDAAHHVDERFLNHVQGVIAAADQSVRDAVGDFPMAPEQFIEGPCVAALEAFDEFGVTLGLALFRPIIIAALPLASDH